jgi:hypothetical protein
MENPIPCLLHTALLLIETLIRLCTKPTALSPAKFTSVTRLCTSLVCEIGILIRYPLLIGDLCFRSQSLGNNRDQDGAAVKMATARASYYAHPLPQLHEYLDRERSLSNAEALRGGTIMSGRTGPYIKPAIQSKYKDADGTGAHAAVAPSSTRAETETRPGPTAQEVKAFLAGMETIEKATEAVERPIGGEDAFWSVKDRMDPHLQLM